MKKIKPFVKWVGGKTQLLNELRFLAPKDFNVYYEPFLGAGAFLLSLQPKRAIVNDINHFLINVYQVIKNNPQKPLLLIKEYDSITCDKNVYYQRRINTTTK